MLTLSCLPLEGEERDNITKMFRDLSLLSLVKVKVGSRILLVSAFCHDFERFYLAGRSAFFFRLLFFFFFFSLFAHV